MDKIIKAKKDSTNGAYLKDDFFKVKRKVVGGTVVSALSNSRSLILTDETYAQDFEETLPIYDTVVKPKHYNTGSEDLIEQWSKHYNSDEYVSLMESHIDKYVKRHRHKGKPIEDLNKAKEYINRLIAYWEE